MADYNFIKDSNMNQDINRINIVKSFLWSNNIEEDAIVFIKKYIADYLITLKDYLNGNSQLYEKLKIYQEPIADAFRINDLIESSSIKREVPYAVKLIISNTNDYGKELEKLFNQSGQEQSKSKQRVLMNHQTHPISDDPAMNAFWQGPLIIGLAIIIGIILSCILYFYK